MGLSNNDKLFNVALFFLNKAKKDKKNINHKKMQKLVYYSQAWNLAINLNTIFPNKIEAWVNWPVVPELYQKYRIHGYSNISTEEKENLNIFSEEELSVLNEVYSIYWNEDTDYLVWLTHQEKPWLEARWELRDNEPSNNIISINTMQDFYKSNLKK